VILIAFKAAGFEDVMAYFQVGRNSLLLSTVEKKKKKKKKKNGLSQTITDKLQGFLTFVK